jgi:hypothetical protein
VTKPVLVERPPPAELVLQCPREPDLPNVFISENERYAWVLKALAAGQQCRDAHDGLRAWATAKS